MVQKVLQRIARLRERLLEDLHERRHSGVVVGPVRVQLPEGGIERAGEGWVRLVRDEWVCGKGALAPTRSVGSGGRQALPSKGVSASGRWIIPMSAGCRLRMLYVNGRTTTTAAGGACKLSCERRFTNDARSVAGRWLWYGDRVSELLRCRSRADVRRAQEALEQAEEARAVLHVEHIPVKECVQPRVKGGVVPAESREHGSRR
jgi:hypothetical protein